MKVVGVREAKEALSEYIDASQDERVIVTRHGRPVAVVYGVEGYDLEQVITMTDPGFWKGIEERRGERTIPLAEARKRLANRARGKKAG